MGCHQNRDTWRFVNAARLHSHEAILDQIDPANAMLALSSVAPVFSSRTARLDSQVCSIAGPSIMPTPMGERQLAPSIVPQAPATAGGPATVQDQSRAAQQKVLQDVNRALEQGAARASDSQP